MRAFLSILLVRYSLVALFLWFGIMQLFDPQAWLTYLPEWTGYIPINPATFIQLNGLFEVILAVALFIGIFTRVAAGLLGLHLLGIAISVAGEGSVALGVRDGVLALCTLSLMVGKPDPWTLDGWKRAEKQMSHSTNV